MDLPLQKRAKTLFLMCLSLLSPFTAFGKAVLASSIEVEDRCKNDVISRFQDLDGKKYHIKTKTHTIISTFILHQSQCPIEISQNFEIKSEHPRITTSMNYPNLNPSVSLHIRPDPNQTRYQYSLSLVYQGEEVARITQKAYNTSKWTGSYLMGANYNVYFPNGANPDQDRLQGIDINYVLFTWDYKNERRGPSLGRVYAQSSLLKGENRDELTVKYGLGIDLSFERNPHRNFLIPIFGLEAGGLYAPHKKTTLHSYQVTPRAGLVLFHNEIIFLSVAGGYVIPFPNLEELRGWDVKAGLHFTLW